MQCIWTIDAANSFVLTYAYDSILAADIVLRIGARSSRDYSNNNGMRVFWFKQFHRINIRILQNIFSTWL